MSDLRPPVSTFEHAGARITLVDAPAILAATGRTELLHRPEVPAPVSRVELAVSRVGAEYVFEGLVRLRSKREFGVLGNDPVGALLSRRVQAGDQWATRVVDSVTDVTRRLGLDAEPDEGEFLGSAVREDAASGLRVTVARHQLASRLRASVAAGVAAEEHLRGAVRVLLDVVTGHAGRTALAGRRLVVSPSGSSDEVTLDQVGGLDDIVGQFRQIAVSFRHPAAMARWGARRPQGILLYGPPGTGKTMLAQALAAEIGADFREIRTPEILDKYLGASERNIKRIFRDARRYRVPTVMLFDEFDSIISYAGLGGDAASQAVNAVAGIFKQEMNSLIEANPNVIVVATTNFPERVDQSLIRSGRFDIKLPVPAPDASGRAQILTKMVRQLIVEHEVAGFRMFGDDVDLDALAEASPGLSGADLKELLRRVQLEKAMDEARRGDAATPITQSDLLAAVADVGRA
jgi:transitional endoplasmic reticulum ATPase